MEETEGTNVVEVSQAARRIFVKDAEGWILASRLAHYSANLYLSLSAGQQQRGGGYGLPGPLRRIQEDLNNVAALLQRIEWTTARTLDETLTKGEWWMYIALDIEHVHIEIRSVLDYVAEVIDLASPKPGQMPHSFRALQEWVVKPGNETRISLNFAQLIRNATWFPSLRGVRDATVHQGGRALVFESPEKGILFQVLGKQWRNLVAEQGVMHNENVVDFRRYAVLLISRLLLFLDDVTQELERTVPPAMNVTSRSYGPWQTFVEWMDAVIATPRAT